MTSAGQPTEPRYTLDEARLKLAQRECGTHGHDFNIVQSGDGSPLLLTCGNGCGAGPWPVTANGER